MALDAAMTVNATCGGITCQANATPGTTLDLISGAPGQIVASAEVLTVSGSFLCGTSATWTTTYSISSQNPMSILP
jgi:hypothetical protein